MFNHKKYFGKPLSDIQRRKTGQCDRRIPSLVYVCVMYLSEPEHVCSEGLFRKCGEETEIEKVKKIINSKSCIGQKSILIKAFDQDVNICTSILKKFLYELPTPLISATSALALPQIIEQNKADELFHLMDHQSADIFVFLLIFLNYVTKYSRENKMTAQNLAICLSPVFCRIGPNTQPSHLVIQEALCLLIQNPEKYCPRNLYETFKVPFQYFLSNTNLQDQKQQEKRMKEERQKIMTPEIQTESDIFDYVMKDRKMFQRPQDWNDMNYAQLVQEYEAMKLASSYYLYNQYIVKDQWPNQSGFESIMNSISQLKMILKQKEGQMQPDCFHTYNVPTSISDLSMFPKTVNELAAFVADIQTEIMTIQQRINKMPDPVTLKRNNDIHTFAERKCLIAKQGHCLRINDVIRQNIEILLRNASL